MLILHRTLFPCGSFEEDQTGVEIRWRPELDVFELPGEYLLSVSLPGVTRKDAEGTVTGSTVVVSVTRRAPLSQPARAHLLESRRGRFERRVRLPANAAPSGIQVEMEEGEMVIRVPKRAATRARRPRVVGAR